MSQVFGFALQRVALFVTLYCVDVGEGSVRVCVCVCVCVCMRERGHERERKRDTLRERVGRRQCVSKDGASGVLLRIEI